MNVKTTKYQVCTRCVMDNASDNTISFDSNGTCNYCNLALERKKHTYYPNKIGEEKLQDLLNLVKKEGSYKKYDCIMGVSGGLDSSYLLYSGAKWGLRILAVHVDDGFDTEVSKKNIKKLIKATGLDYIVETPDPEQFNALTKAYFFARVPNLAVAQDNLIFAHMYKLARTHKIKYFLSGGNFALESILQSGNTYRVFDTVNIKAIHKQYGTKPINKLQLLSDYQRFIDQKILKIETLRPLDLINYQRDKALAELENFCDFEYYGSKHLENTLTKFIQTYWFYHKFGVDKRKSHLSSMIISEQMSREQALKELEKPIYDDSIHNDIDFILKKLKIASEDFKEIMKLAPKQHEDYKTDKFYPLVKKIFY